MNGSLLTILRRRLVIAGMVLTLLNIAVISLWYVNWESLRREKVDEQVAAVAAAVARDANGVVRVALPPHLDRLFSEHPQAYAFSLRDADGQVLAARNPALIPDVPMLPAAMAALDSVTSSAATPLGRTFAETRKVMFDGTPYLVTFAALTDPARLTWGVYFDELIGHVLLPLAPFALLLTLINIWTVRRSLMPLVDAARAARQVGITRSVEALPTQGLPDEVRALVEATNEALGRLKAALDHERAFNAEAAHALRTPLAVLSARLSTMDGDTLQPLRADVAAMTRLVNQMLASAQADALAISPDQSCDLADVAGQVVAQMAPLAIRQGRHLALDSAGPAPVRGDADALAHAARNLIENALRHAPEGSEITVRVRGGELAVEDRGPGIPASQKPLALKRFWRATPGDGQGSGLGLPIAERITRAHGGALRLEDREGGGARVVLAVEAVAMSPHG
jgi:two-component system OmpR family sensor kinase